MFVFLVTQLVLEEKLSDLLQSCKKNRVGRKNDKSMHVRNKYEPEAKAAKDKEA